MKRNQIGFSILLMEEDAIEIVGTSIRISRLASVKQINCKPWFICNLRESPYNITPSVNV